jgi:DNA polymerase-1
MVTSSGQVTNAVYGLTAMLIKLQLDERPDAVVVCMDKGKPQFRLDRYPEYKAGRAETPDAFRQQLPLMREVLEALRIPIVELQGYEADDLLATLAKSGREAGHEVIIVSGDRDCLQLVNDDVTVLMTRRGITDIIRYDPETVASRYGVPPDKWTNFAALKGEPADNLPGIPGVGEKTAAQLLQKYGDIEGIIAHAEELTPKVRKGVETCGEQVKLNRELGYLLEDAPIEIDPGWFQRQPWDDEEVRKLFNSLEFKTLYERLKGLGLQAPSEESVVEVEAVTEPTTTEDFPRDQPVAVAWKDTLVAFCGQPGHAAILPFDRVSGADELLADADVAKVMHDAKPLYRAMFKNGTHLKGLTCDLKIAAYLLDPGAAAGYSLQDILQRYLDASIGAPEETAPKRGQLSLAGVETIDPGLKRRLAAEAVGAQAVAPVLEARLRELGIWELAETLEFPLIEVLSRMEETGILVDAKYLSGLDRELGEKMTFLQDKVQEHADEKFNVNSHPQLGRILFEKLALPKTKKIKTGYSTDAAELTKLSGKHPIVDTLLEYREVAKLKTGFTDSLLGLIDSKTGRIHTTYEQATAATGRLSSSAPNLQNIPIRADLGRQIRRAFVAPPDQVLLSADYSQIELRVLAHVSGDQSFLDAFAQGHDFHVTIAAKVYGVDLEQVTTEMRSHVKQFSYGIAYGMSAFGVSQRLGIDVNKAKDFIEAYYAQFPKVKAFLDSQVEQAKVDGYTTTLFGRRRYVPELQSANYRLRSVGERMALNAPIQGTAADIMKKAMIDVDRRLRQEPVARMLLTVHDELVFEVPEPELDKATRLIKEGMEGAADLRCGLVVDIHTGLNWAEAHA